MAAARYHYTNSEGTIHGPLWLSQMRDLWKGGKINMRTEVCMDGTKRWEQVEFFPEIYDEDARLPVFAKLRRSKSDNGRLIAWLVVLLLGFAVYLMQRWGAG